jgi:hypothetical protein
VKNLKAKMKMRTSKSLPVIVHLLCCFVQLAASFQLSPRQSRDLLAKRSQTSASLVTVSILRPVAKSSRSIAVAGSQSDEEYRNAATKFLSSFMSKESDDKSPLDDIDFDAPKLTNLPLSILAQALDAELYASEWFVTGRVNPVYFADSFSFQDPDVKLSGIEEYARGVNKLFDQQTARAEIISTAVTKDNTITCTWRLSGKVDIGPGLSIKPYIVYTDFTVDPQSGLIVFQEDRFDLPQWDILLSALFPFVIGRITSLPAPNPEPRVPPPSMPNLGKFLKSNRDFPIQGVKDMLDALIRRQ